MRLSPFSESEIMKNTPNNVLIAVVVIFSISLLAVTGLIIANRPIDNVLYLLAAVLIPTFVGVVSNKSAVEAKNAAEDATNKLSTVHKLVNGNTSRLLDMLEASGTVDAATLANARQRLYADGYDPTNTPVAGVPTVRTGE